MILIYTDSQILDIDWLSKLDFGSEYTVVHDYETYCAGQADHKVAFTTHRLHCDHDAYKTFEDKILDLSYASDLVFTFESELHNYHWQMWERCHRPNVYWVLPGQVNDSAMNDNIIFWGDWFKTTTQVYKQLPNKLAEITYGVNKPRSFDALLGVLKPHRDYVYSAVNSHNLNDKFVLTYGGAWDDNKFYADKYFAWEPDCVPVGKIIGTADWVDYCGVRTGLSRVIPIQVFNDTAHSIVAETDHDNTLSFFSEKTAKPLIARRMFVAFSGYKFLHNLRNQGFLTFSDVIDESYDLIENSQDRYKAAFDQVRRLCDIDQVEVYNTIKGILEHNHRHIMGTNWTQFAANKIQKQLDIMLAQAS
jgi:hypothetical protein